MKTISIGVSPTDYEAFRQLARASHRSIASLIRDAMAAYGSTGSARLATHAARSDFRYTPDEYLARERVAETKSEWIDGRIVAMSGASVNHNRVTVNVVVALVSQLRGGGCELFTGDMRVAVENNLYTYSDVVVVCGVARFLDAELDTLANPTLIVEVLSPSTEAWDRGEKFRRYQGLASLHEYVLVSQERPVVDQFTRRPDGSWLLNAHNQMEDVVELASVGARLSMAEVYRAVPFSSGE